ncbi:MAG TPA: carboxypeptidase-like regulatory domain-containing protein, partial [Chitinophagales bacterium]|nr:carboxypeptidase-like regulatory domain-containing protein [Chitinophagales bacterium]
MKHAAALVALLLIFLFTNAQINQVTGRVLDEQGKPLQGASIHVLNTTNGAITDIDGSYTLLNIPAGAQKIALVYLGLTPDTINVTIGSEKKIQLQPVTLKEKQEQMGEVVITSSLKQGGEAKAINITKNSEKLITVISAENIAKYPDHNGAEALKRVAGAAVQYDKGEGAYISLRGTPLDWTATLVNGNRLPVADEENFTRTFEFEVLPADLVDYIEVTRTVTPDMDGDNVGGAINFKTKYEVDRRSLEVSLAGGMSALTLKPSGNLHFSWADVSKNKKFSYAISTSYYGRYYGAQAYLLAYGSNFNQAANRFELKDYDGTRQTVGGNLFLQYKFSPKFKLTGKILVGTMLDD